MGMTLVQCIDDDEGVSSRSYKYCHYIDLYIERRSRMLKLPVNISHTVRHASLLLNWSPDICTKDESPLCLKRSMKP
jgi:hypothetical protein